MDCLRRHTCGQSKRLLGRGARVESIRVRDPGRLLCHMARSLSYYGDGISFWVVFGQSVWLSALPGCKLIAQPRSMPVRRLLAVVGHMASPFDLPHFSSVFLTRTSCCKIIHTNGYYGAWSRWGVSVSVFPLTSELFSSPFNELFLGKKWNSRDLLSSDQDEVTVTPPLECLHSVGL